MKSLLKLLAYIAIAAILLAVTINNFAQSVHFGYNQQATDVTLRVQGHNLPKLTSIGIMIHFDTAMFTYDDIVIQDSALLTNGFCLWTPAATVTNTLTLAWFSSNSVLFDKYLFCLKLTNKAPGCGYFDFDTLGSNSTLSDTTYNTLHCDFTDTVVCTFYLGITEPTINEQRTGIYSIQGQKIMQPKGLFIRNRKLRYETPHR
jgi:hypothetical protein